MKNFLVSKLTLSAMFLAMGLLLPFLTGQIPQVGSALLPMHIPVLLCGLICGWQYGGLIGFIMPIMRSFVFGMPPLFPTAVSMALEMAAYGIIIGLCYAYFPKKNSYLFLSLFSAMIIGRIVWGIVQLTLAGVGGNAFTWQIFIAGAFVNAIPGIILQLFLIPAVMITLQSNGVLSYER